MNRSELVAAVAAHNGNTQALVDRVLRTAERQIAQHLAGGGHVRLVGFGAYTCRPISEHPGRHPRTGELITVPAHRKIVFNPGKALRYIVENGAARA